MKLIWKLLQNVVCSHIPFTLHFLSKAISVQQEKCRYKNIHSILTVYSNIAKWDIAKANFEKKNKWILLHASLQDLQATLFLNVVYFFYVCLCLFIIFVQYLGFMFWKLTWKNWKCHKMKNRPKHLSLRHY